VGFLTNFGLGHAAPIQAAQPLIVAPQQNVWAADAGLAYCNRNEAMQVPSVARARNIIAGTIGTLPLFAYSDITRQRLYGRTLLKQADPSVPQSITITWTVEDLLFHGVAYWQTLETDPESGRPTRARRINPERVSYTTDTSTGLVEAFYIDQQPVPMAGIGSLKMFNGPDDGILARAGRTIRTALNLERAAARMADEPVPSMVLKNSGVDLPPDQVSGLLAAWRNARQSRTTAYLNSSIDVQSFGYDPQSLQLVESRQHTATEVARMVGVPAWYLNAEVSSMTYANVTSERRSLVDFSLRPYIAAIEQRLSMDDMTARGTTVRFVLDDYLRGNPLEQVEVLAKMQDYGWIDQDEARAMLDLAPRGMDNGTSQELSNNGAS
jgi:HK97 family phage portal protein